MPGVIGLELLASRGVSKIPHLLGVYGVPLASSIITIIQGVQFCHVFWTKVEVINISVGANTGWVGGFREGRESEVMISAKRGSPFAYLLTHAAMTNGSGSGGSSCYAAKSLNIILI